MTLPHDHTRSLPDISIVICTYNRAPILIDTLESYASLERSNHYQAELLIVDNNSNDDTRSIAERFKAQHLETRYVFEPQPGLSHARNTGIQASRGDIIAFVDDDVFFESQWLTEVVNIFRDYPEASCMGGKSIPQFEGGTPDWITVELLTLYGSTNSGDTIKWMIYPEYPFGLNMAFKRTVFDQIGLFNTRLGRKKKNLLSNEENDIFWRISQAGLKVIYSPHARLYHRIPVKRTCHDWVLARYYWQGISDIAFRQTIAPRSRFTLLSESIRDGWKLARRVTGKHCSPQKAYWHYKAAKFPEQLYRSLQWGRVRRMIEEAFRFSTG